MNVMVIMGTDGRVSEVLSPLSQHAAVVKRAADAELLLARLHSRMTQVFGDDPHLRVNDAKIYDEIRRFFGEW